MNKVKNMEIIKNSLSLPLRRYKEFAIITLLFFLAEVIQEHILHHTHNEPNIILLLIAAILPIIVLGINLQIIFHIIDDNRGIPKISMKKSVKEGMQDVVLESYYFIFAVITTILISIITGILQNFHDIFEHLNYFLMETGEMNVIEMMGALPDLMLLNNPKVFFILLIFITILIIFFSMCTLGKIDIEVTHNYKQAFNLKHIFELIKRIGIEKYLGFIILTVILCTIIANIVFILKSGGIVESIISALLESFSLVFFLNSFAQLYPD